MNLTGLALRNLRRRPIRTALSILGIALAVGGALALLALSRSIQDATRDGMDEIGDDLAVTQKDASDIFAGFLAADTEARVAKVAGVARAAGEMFMFAPSENNRQVLTVGWPETSFLWGKIPLREGRVPSAGERKAVVVGDATADVLGKKVGDQIEIFGDAFTVVGISKYKAIINRGTVIMPLADLQELSYRPSQVTMVHVNVARDASSAEIARVRHDIEALGGVMVSTSSESLGNDRNFKILNAVSLAISIIALAMGVIYVLNSLVMATQERTREIGIVAAIGWSDTRIMTSIVIEGLVMCAIGCVFGVLLSFFAAFAFPLIPTIGDMISFRPSLRLMAATISAAFALCAIGALYPAWRAVSMMPAEALRRA
jgi:putative ABC transport system permease protein